MRKPLKSTLIIVGILVAIPVLTLATTSIVNVVATNSEVSSITPYGRLVPVDGKQMNVVVRGQGEETIVLLPGLGTAAPALDFEPLIAEFEDSYRVVAIEPFGTGLSDQTDVERTAANITREVHEALQFLGIDRYVLMGHSIAGIYALTYSAAYADELIAFVGIDSSVPGQAGSDEPIPTEAMVTLRDLGITRILSQLVGDPYAGLAYAEETKQQMTFLATKNGTAPTILNEMENAAENFASVSEETFPKDLPVLLFVVGDAAEVEGWVELHERQVASVGNGQMIILEGGHYLHHTLSSEIARDTAAFLAKLS